MHWGSLVHTAITIWILTHVAQQYQHLFPHTHYHTSKYTCSRYMSLLYNIPPTITYHQLTLLILASTQPPFTQAKQIPFSIYNVLYIVHTHTYIRSCMPPASLACSGSPPQSRTCLTIWVDCFTRKRLLQEKLLSPSLTETFSSQTAHSAASGVRANPTLSSRLDHTPPTLFINTHQLQ